MFEEENNSPFESLRKFMNERAGMDKKIYDVHAQSASDGRADVAEAIHIMMDEINRSADLNVAAMLCLSKTFEAVFSAFRAEVDAKSVHEDDDRRFLMESGIVCADDGCSHCAPGAVRLHDLQIVAGISAMRFFLFSRLRKIETTLPLVREIVSNGNLDMAAAMLEEAMSSASSMMKSLEKLGFSVAESHPVAIKSRAGANEAIKLMDEIIAAIEARDASK